MTMIASIIHELRVSGHPTEEQWADAIERLRSDLACARKALEEIAARARFEQDSPTEMRDTAFSLIEKSARTALTEIAH